MKDVWSSTNGGRSWSLQFSRPFNDWEVDEVHRFLLSLNGKSVLRDVEDRVLWIETKCGKFSIKSLYKALVSSPPVFFPSNVIWKACVQPKVSFFRWEATWEKSLTLDQLQKRGQPLAIDATFAKCIKNRQTTSSSIVPRQGIYGRCFSLFGVQWVLPTTIKATLLGQDGSFVGKKRKEVWRADPLCIFWTVQKARNIIAFEDDVLSIQRLKSSFVFFLWSETILFIKYGPSTLVGFIDQVGSR